MREDPVIIRKVYNIYTYTHIYVLKRIYKHVYLLYDTTLQRSKYRVSLFKTLKKKGEL